MAEVKFHVYDGKMVHAIYSDVVDSALTAGITAETIMAEISEAPEMKELRALNVHCKPSGDKFVVRAVLRYVPVDESESM